MKPRMNMWTYNHSCDGNHVDVARAKVSFETARPDDRCGSIFMVRRLFTDAVCQVFLHIHSFANWRPGEVLLEYSTVELY
jgi:hypothetical protein